MKHTTVNRMLVELVSTVLYPADAKQELDKNKLIEIAKEAKDYISIELVDDIKQEFKYFLKPNYKGLTIHKAIRAEDVARFTEYINLSRQDNTMEYYSDIMNVVFRVLNHQLDKLYGPEYLKELKVKHDE